MASRKENPDPSQTQRLRDNKRRHRARQKEYTASLEQRLRVFEQEGVQATIEVQVSARKVVRENRRLRALLEAAGISEAVVERWVSETGEGGEVDMSKDEIGSIRVEKLDLKSSAKGPSTAATLVGERAPPTVARHDISPVSPRGSEGTRMRRQQETIQPNLTAEPNATSYPQLQSPPPCKLMTLLSVNPSADLTQVPLPNPSTSSAEGDARDDGVPCERAYQMLMHYATTGPKMDAVAKVLEEGCTPSSGGGSECRVRKEVVWKALDDICV